MKQAILSNNKELIEKKAKEHFNSFNTTNKKHYKIYSNGEKTSFIWVGLGAPSISKCVDELSKKDYKKLIYVSTFGGMSNKPKIGDIYVVIGAVRREGTSETYVHQLYPAIPSFELNRKIAEELEKNNINFNTGVVWTEDGYWSHVDDLELKDKFQFEYWRSKRIFGIEMECSAFFITSQIRDIKSAAVLICNREWKQIKSAWKGEEVEWNVDKNKVENSLEKSFDLAYNILKEK